MQLSKTKNEGAGLGLAPLRVRFCGRPLEQRALLFHDLQIGLYNRMNILLVFRFLVLMELMGIEPTTSGLQNRRSPS